MNFSEREGYKERASTQLEGMSKDALKGIEKPIGISEYQLTRAIPENLKSNLPSIEEIEAELNELDDKK